MIGTSRRLSAHSRTIHRTRSQNKREEFSLRQRLHTSTRTTTLIRPSKSLSRKIDTRKNEHGTIVERLTEQQDDRTIFKRSSGNIYHTEGIFINTTTTNISCCIDISFNHNPHLAIRSKQQRRRFFLRHFLSNLRIPKNQDHVKTDTFKIIYLIIS